MKICLIGSKTYPSRIGGIETHVFELAPRLASRGHKVSVIVGRDNNKKYEEIEGVEVYRVFHSNSRLTIKISMVPEAIIKAKKIQADVNHLHSGVFGGFGSLLLNNTVFTVHGSFTPYDYPFPFNKLDKLVNIIAFKKAKQVIAVDSKTANEVAKYNKHVHIIGNGINTEKFDRQVLIPKEYKNGIKILYVGRLIHRKGAHLLIEAFSKLPRKMKENVSLIIIGEGPMKSELILKTKKQENINFLGYVENIVPYLVHSDIFVLPSIYEGLPIALLEAMASSNACVATDIADISQRFNNGKELILVEPGNVDELSRSLSDLINDDRKRQMLARNAKDKMKKDYDWDSIVDQIEKIYKETLNKTKKLSYRR